MRMLGPGMAQMQAKGELDDEDEEDEDFDAGGAEAEVEAEDDAASSSGGSEVEEAAPVSQLHMQAAAGLVRRIAAESPV